MIFAIIIIIIIITIYLIELNDAFGFLYRVNNYRLNIVGFSKAVN